MTITVDAKLAERAFGHLENRLANTDSPMAITRAYLRGEQTLPYMPRNVQGEFKDMAKRSITNWLPLVSDTFVKRLSCDGYRPDGTLKNAKAWDYWQANRLDARQSIVYRGAIDYGAGWVAVLPGKRLGKDVPVIKPLDPLRTMAWYNDDDDEFPYVAAYRLEDHINGATLIEIYTDQDVYTFQADSAGVSTPLDAAPDLTNGGAGTADTKPLSEGRQWEQLKVAHHGLGVVPIVRFRERLDDRRDGAIYPLIPDQERINEVVFAIHMALQYGVFRQRYVTGMALPEDEAGNPVNPFTAGASTLWIAESDEAKFGEFSQVQLSDHLNAYQKAVQTLAVHAAIDPNMLTGDIINVSSGSLGALKDSTTQQLNIYKMIFGEAWEQVFRVAALANGDYATIDDVDLTAKTRWRDDTHSEYLDTVNMLAILVDKLDVPPEALWTKVPGMDEQDLEAWQKAADKAKENDPMAALAAAAAKQTGTPPLPGQPPQQPDPATPPAPGQLPQQEVVNGKQPPAGRS